MPFHVCSINKWLIVLKVVRPSEVRHETWFCKEKNIFIGETVLSYFLYEKVHLLKLGVGKMSFQAKSKNKHSLDLQRI